MRLVDKLVKGKSSVLPEINRIQNGALHGRGGSGEFAPDADPTSPGVLTDCDDIIPTLRGVQALPGDSDAGITTAVSALVASSSLKKLDDSTRVFSGSNTSLYEIVTSTWTNRNKLDSTSSATLTYSLNASHRWSFTQYNNQSFAAQKGDVIQASSSGRFADLTSAPKARFVEVVLDFVIGFDIDGDTNRWKCCAAGVPGSWTADVATQANTGLLVDTPGPICLSGSYSKGTYPAPQMLIQPLQVY